MKPGGGEVSNSSGDSGGEGSSSSQEIGCQAAESVGYSDDPCKSAGFFSSNSPAGSLQRPPNFKNKVSIDDGERSSLLNSETGPRSAIRTVPENPALLHFIAAHAWKRCVSLPVEPTLDLSPSVPGGETPNLVHGISQRQETPMVPRSLSVPMRNVIVLRSGSLGSPEKLVPKDSDNGPVTPTYISSDDVQIPEEEAVCRICLSEVTEGRGWLKMECSCKGALQLTHEECAVKWFSIKGNKNCDVCGKEVLNLPVTLFWVQSSPQRDNIHQHDRQSSSSHLTRAWHDLVVLVLISTMCYFFFLEQLLVNDMKARAIIIAAPVSFTLAILSSVCAVTLVCREYIWAYSAFQFSLVGVLLHVLYNTLRLRAVFAVLLSAVAGMGMAIGVNSICLQLFAWRNGNVRAQMNANLA